MQGTGFCPNRCEIAKKKYAVCSAARSCSAARGYASKKHLMKSSAMMTAQPPPLFTPANRSSTRFNQSPVRFLNEISTHRFSCETNINLNSLLICDITKIDGNAFHPNQGFEKSLFSFPFLPFRKPLLPLFFRQLEHSIVKLLPQFHSPRCNFV